MLRAVKGVTKSMLSKMLTKLTTQTYSCRNESDIYSIEITLWDTRLSQNLRGLNSLAEIINYIKKTCLVAYCVIMITLCD